MAIEGVAAAKLCAGVSITLVRESDGSWRFNSWATYFSDQLEVKPTSDHAGMRFTSFEAGVDFFRDEYAALITARL
jgi:hypothetical protein